MINLEMADMSSIAFELQQFIEVPSVEYGYPMGKLFCDNYVHNVNPHIVLKNMRFNKLGLLIAGFISEQEYRITKPIPVYSNDGSARCTVRLVKNPTEEDLESRPFYMKDLLGELSEYVIVDCLESISNGSGIKLLRTVVDYFKGTPIVIQAGYLYSGDYNSLEYSQKLIDLPERLADMYSKEGFVNVNDTVGNYEDSIIMINYNTGKEAANSLESPKLVQEDLFSVVTMFLSVPSWHSLFDVVLESIRTLCSNNVQHVDYKDEGIYVCKCPRYAIGIFDHFAQRKYLAILPVDLVSAKCPEVVVISNDM